MRAGIVQHHAMPNCVPRPGTLGVYGFLLATAICAMPMEPGRAADYLDATRLSCSDVLDGRHMVEAVAFAQGVIFSHVQNALMNFAFQEAPMDPTKSRSQRIVEVMTRMPFLGRVDAVDLASKLRERCQSNRSSDVLSESLVLTIPIIRQGEAEIRRSWLNPE